jgi:malate dehydrogenase
LRQKAEEPGVMHAPKKPPRNSKMATGKRFRIASIGAGNVGAAVAQYCLEMELGDVILTDIVEGLPQGKALDLTEAGPIRGYSGMCTGTSDYSDIEGCDLVIVSAGLPRRPGMTRLDLLEKNGRIMTEICENIRKYAPDSTVILITNPLDVMVYLAHQKLGFPAERVMGMAGCLDSARMRAFVAMELGVSMKNVDTMVLGSHGDDMVPLPRYTTVSGIPITHLLTEDRIAAIVERTRKGGGEIVQLMKTGSAFYAPGASAARMAQAILRDEKQVLPCAAYLTGQYGLEDIYMGVPCLLGKDGVEKIVELEISEADRASLHNSAEEVRTGISGLREAGIL